jgi:5-methylthioribose kinase
VLRDAAGFAGAKMLRRIVGFAHVADLDSIEDEEARAGAERLAIRSARELITGRSRLAGFEGVERIVRRRIHREP